MAAVFSRSRKRQPRKPAPIPRKPRPAGSRRRVGAAGAPARETLQAGAPGTERRRTSGHGSQEHARRGKVCLHNSPLCNQIAGAERRPHGVDGSQHQPTRARPIGAGGGGFFVRVARLKNGNALCSSTHTLVQHRNSQPAGL